MRALLFIAAISLNSFLFTYGLPAEALGRRENPRTLKVHVPNPKKFSVEKGSMICYGPGDIGGTTELGHAIKHAKWQADQAIKLLDHPDSHQFEVVLSLLGEISQENLKKGIKKCFRTVSKSLGVPLDRVHERLENDISVYFSCPSGSFRDTLKCKKKDGTFTLAVTVSHQRVDKNLGKFSLLGTTILHEAQRSLALLKSTDLGDNLEDFTTTPINCKNLENSNKKQANAENWALLGFLAIPEAKAPVYYL
ncbi:hypothetical protein BT96DRAFT_950675 [Gymnopus androsaceus JB14]|uniref:Uncharacterized protein n=1 Tax=Gymnopus androsaceus JB14 TaxID=1447944 RepID=A0A6A4GFB2_9AGAR|nr:hypothetical protein BT96DRAFT_950675 [Gymnopus androsaceus JB14]